MTKYPLEVPKVWGRELWIVNNENYCGKILYLNEGFQCSFLHHKIKTETFYILKGSIYFNFSNIWNTLKPGNVVHIKPGVDHQFLGFEDSEILEISTQHFEDDSYRSSESRKVW